MQDRCRVNYELDVVCELLVISIITRLCRVLYCCLNAVCSSLSECEYKAKKICSV